MFIIFSNKEYHKPVDKERLVNYLFFRTQVFWLDFMIIIDTYQNIRIIHFFFFRLPFLLSLVGDWGISLFLIYFKLKDGSYFFNSSSTLSKVVFRCSDNCAFFEIDKSSAPSCFKVHCLILFNTFLLLSTLHFTN